MRPQTHKTPEIKRIEWILSAQHLLGALLAGVLVVHGLTIVVLLPLIGIGIAIAFAEHRRSGGGFPGAANPTASEGVCCLKEPRRGAGVQSNLDRTV